MATPLPSGSPAVAFSDCVSGRLEDGVLVVVIDNPPVNAASTAVRKGLLAAIHHASDEDSVRGVVVTGAGRAFVGGADIREFDTPVVEPALPEVLALMEGSEKPVVAAINGVALGGGCEIALACHVRLASAEAKLGLPEVKLGIIPGAGGTQRLPRLTGMAAAVEMIATGRIVNAAEAHRLGIVDTVVQGDLLDTARKEAGRLAGAPPRRSGELRVPAFDAAVVDSAAAKALARSRGQAAPAEAIRLVRSAAELPFAEALIEERATFLRLRGSDQAKALRHVFFAERAAAKVRGIEGAEPRSVRTVAVIGAGLMGSGIAVCALDAGYQVICVEQTAERAAAGRDRIAALYDRAIASGRLDEAGKASRMARLRVADRLDAVADADLVIEAVFDD
ncbi:MAG: enoyl-CoA hydratase/isomerase family protein, partial [Rhizobiaceae bacterium]|nr:enoyl-CoA hydratase/isomerase family protein [Rhizobiaceae bacterium]